MHHATAPTLRSAATCLALLGLLLLAPTLAGADGPHTDREGARRLPAPDERDSFHFVIFGDRTGGPAEGIRVLAQAVEDTNLLKPDLVMTVGDLIQGYNQTDEWLQQMREYRATMKPLSMPWYPVAGNHDTYWRGPNKPAGEHDDHYEKHFGPLWYWFEHKNCGFVVLYTDEGNTEKNRKGWNHKSVNRFSQAQLDWLKATLDKTKALDKVFVFMHHPRWYGSYYPGTNWETVHDMLEASGNVSAVFAGHMHRIRYDGIKDGIAYHTLAATGGGIPHDSPSTGWMHHLHQVTVRPEGITVACIPVGQVVDPRKFTPEWLKQVEQLFQEPILLPQAPLPIDPSRTRRGVAKVAFTNPSTYPIEVTARIDAGDWNWQFHPEHQHVRLAPGERAELATYWRRVPPGKLAVPLAPPRLSVEIDVLHEGARIRLPERRRTFPIVLDHLPEVGSEAPARALDTRGGRGALTVPSSWLPIPDGPLTVEGWIKARTYQGRRGFVTKTQNSEYGLFVSDGRPAFSVFLGKRYVEAAGAMGRLKPGRWYHLAGVFDGREVRLYVDGQLVEAVPGSGPRRVNELPLYVGADVDRRGHASSPVDALIDHVRISRVARYSGARAEGYDRAHVADADTVLLLPLDRHVGPFTPNLAPEALVSRRHPLRRGPVAYPDGDTAPMK